MTGHGFDLTEAAVHLGLGATAEALVDFEWTPEYLAAYERARESDGDEARLVVLSGDKEGPWAFWERHPSGDELVVRVSGRATIHQEMPGGVVTTELGPSQALINPKGIWHTADVHEAGLTFFVTAGRGTDHKPR